MEKVARYITKRNPVTGIPSGRTNKPRYSHEAADSDSGGVTNNRRSTSRGMRTVGHHCIETWSAFQGAVAPHSAEAKHYAMMGIATRAKD